MDATGWILVLGLLSAVPSGAADLPIEFRCDSMQLQRLNHRYICRGNVIVRQGNLTLCCQQLEGLTDLEGRWQEVRCSRDVRLQRLNDLAWGERAVYRPDRRQATLTGAPILRRGESVLTGRQIVIHLDSDRVDIDGPAGHVHPETVSQSSPQSEQTAPLPAVCPLPAAGRRP